MPAKILLLALLLGSAGGGLTAWALSSTGGAEPSSTAIRHAAADPLPGAAARSRRGGDRPQPILLGRPDAASPDRPEAAALAERLEALEAEQATLRQRIDSLEEELHPVDLDALSEEELTARASTLHAFRNYAGTLEAYSALLARDPDLDVETRSKVLNAIAQCHRALADPGKAEEVFRQLEALHGEGSAGAMAARYQRAWLRHAQGDLEGAREFMRQVAESPNAPRFWKLFSRANAADFSIRLGDTAQVRGDLEDFRSELEGDDSQTGQRVLDYVNQLLEQLDD